VYGFPLLIGVNVLFAVLTTLLWTTHVGQKKAKGRRRAGCRREEFSMDPPPFRNSSLLGENRAISGHFRKGSLHQDARYDAGG
jgi:hypothetical protein